MPTLVEIGPSNASQGQHRRKEATKYVVYICICIYVYICCIYMLYICYIYVVYMLLYIYVCIYMYICICCIYVYVHKKGKKAAK